MNRHIFTFSDVCTCWKFFIKNEKISIHKKVIGKKLFVEVEILGWRAICILTMHSHRKQAALFTYLPIYLYCYWRIPLEGTPENVDGIELPDLHDVNNKHGNTPGGYDFVSFEITVENATDADNCRLGLLAYCQNFVIVVAADVPTDPWFRHIPILPLLVMCVLHLTDM